MIKVIIGARGTGKTSLLKRFQFYVGSVDVDFLDLDEEIQKFSQQDIGSIFSKSGEAEFRKLEQAIFSKLLEIPEDKMRIISVGAGFDLKLIPDGTEVIWVMRDSDELGRIFLDRPRLNEKLDPLSEYLEKWKERKANYLTYANSFYIIPEGLQGPHLVEKQILTGETQDVGGIVTAMPNEVGEISDLIEKIKDWIKQGVDYVELRDDLYSCEQIAIVLQTVDTSRVLYSIRNSSTVSKAIELINRHNLIWDWPLELGVPVNEKMSIVSDHTSKSVESLRNTTAHFEKLGAHIKWSPEVATWQELAACIQWQAEEPQKRSLLPRSAHGTLKWIRLFLKGKQGLNFWREGLGSSVDQPSLFEWLNHPNLANKFAAVLGSPVKSSWTPITQSGFFCDWNIPTYAIDISSQEFDTAFSQLCKMGLVAVAVTAPLKTKMFDKIVNKQGELTAPALHLRAVNTVWIQEEKLYGHNTDLKGFRELVKDLDPNLRVAVWGGGGITSVIADVLPDSSFYGSTSGKVKRGADLDQVDVLIWAAPRGDKMMFPPAKWAPKLVIDVNYVESSGGREYSTMVKCAYRSGAMMFFEQAKGQREFWIKFLESI